MSVFYADRLFGIDRSDIYAISLILWLRLPVSMILGRNNPSVKIEIALNDYYNCIVIQLIPKIAL